MVQLHRQRSWCQRWSSAQFMVWTHPRTSGGGAERTSRLLDSNLMVSSLRNFHFVHMWKLRILIWYFRLLKCEVVDAETSASKRVGLSLREKMDRWMNINIIIIIIMSLLKCKYHKCTIKTSVCPRHQIKSQVCVFSKQNAIVKIAK